MTVLPARDPPSFASSSAGLCHSDASYLDSHFRAAQPEYEGLLRSVGIRADAHVLDAGCGSGSFFPALCDLVGPTGRITAIDLAKKNCAVVNARWLRRAGLLDVRQTPLWWSAGRRSALSKKSSSAR